MKLPSQAKPAIRIPLPIGKRVGLGDAIKGVTQRFGIDPCQGCQKRAAMLNRWVGFTPYRSGDS